VLTLAERADATREAAQESSGLTRELTAGQALSPAAERLLAGRADHLVVRLQTRAPVIERILSLGGGQSWLAPAAMLLAVTSGVSMSALHGSQRVDLLAFPLLGLIAWNAVWYVALALSAVRRPRRRDTAREAWLPRQYERWLRGRTQALLRSSWRYNQPLATALQRFANEWAAVARPLLIARGRRLLHVCAALVALGLIAGLYVRGLVLRYDAGWDSTFLSAGGVRALLHAVYGPASAISGIPLPESLQAMEALRWNGGRGGVPAAGWIHLMALTALLYIVLPRVIAAAAASSRLYALAQHPTQPAALVRYARAIVGGMGGLEKLSARVTTYAYEPTPQTLAGLSALLSDALGGEVELELTAKVPYGGEDAFAAQLRDARMAAAECHVLLMSLSATPEPENHGQVLAALRGALGGKHPRGALLVLIDQGPYAVRMRGDASYERRMQERGQVWREFVAAHGLTACLVDLSGVRPGPDNAAAERADVLNALQWPTR
jgi:hypothetical protein